MLLCLDILEEHYNIWQCDTHFYSVQLFVKFKTEKYVDANSNIDWLTLLKSKKTTSFFTQK